MTRRWKRLLGGVLSAAMLVGLLPTSALAVHNNDSDTGGGLGMARIYLNEEEGDLALPNWNDESFKFSSSRGPYSAYNGAGDYIYQIPITDEQLAGTGESIDLYANAQVEMMDIIANTLTTYDTLDVTRTRFTIFMAVSESIQVDTTTSWLFNSTFLKPDDEKIQELTNNGVTVRAATADEYTSSYTSDTAIDMGWVLEGNLDALRIENQEGGQQDTATTTGGFDFESYLQDLDYLEDAHPSGLDIKTVSDKLNEAFISIADAGMQKYNANIYAIPVEMNWAEVRDAAAAGTINLGDYTYTDGDENKAAGGGLYSNFSMEDFMFPMQLTSLSSNPNDADDTNYGIHMEIDLNQLKRGPRADTNGWLAQENGLESIDRFIPTADDIAGRAPNLRTDWWTQVDSLWMQGVIASNLYAYDSDDAEESTEINDAAFDLIDAGSILIQFIPPVHGSIDVVKNITVADGVGLTDTQKAALTALSGTKLPITVTDENSTEVDVGEQTLELTWSEETSTLTGKTTLSDLPSDVKYTVSVAPEATAELENAGLYRWNILTENGEDIDLTTQFRLGRDEDGNIISKLKDGQENPTVTVTSTYSTEKPATPTVTLTYDPNGGDGPDKEFTQDLVDGKAEFTVIENPFTRDEVNGVTYSFTGWNTRADGTGTDYAPDSTITLTEDETLYAQWKAEGEEPPVETSDTVLSKTLSGNLDENGETNVTLSIPSDGYKQTVDVVLAVDCTSYLENAGSSVIRNIGEMADTLLEKNVHLNVGAVAFGNDAAVVSEITALNKGNSDSWASEVAAKIWDENLWEDKNSGTNIQLGVRTARELLDRSTSGADENHQYIVLITDGGGFWYCDEEGNSVNQYFSHGSTISEMVNMDANETSVCGEERLTVSTYSKYSEESDEHTFGTFLKDHGDAIEASAAGSISKAEAQAAAADPELMAQLAARAPTAAEIQSFDTYPYTNIERGVYYAAKELLEAKDDGVHIVTVGYPYYAAHDNVVLDTLSQEFLAWTGEIGTHYDGNNLGNAFSDLADQITYFVDAGSYVIDQMGSGTDDGWSYDFDFVNDAQYLTLTVGGETRTVTSLGENS